MRNFDQKSIQTDQVKAWEAKYGHEVDPLANVFAICGTQDCVNPDHLTVVFGNVERLRQQLKDKPALREELEGTNTPVFART